MAPPAALDETPLLRTTGLTKQYAEGTVALRGIDLEVPRGSVGLVGANGAGKTTLFRLMLGLSRPTSGSLEVCGLPVASRAADVRARVGFMPEHDCLPLDQSAADVVSTFGELAGLPPRAARQRASEVLDLVGLDEERFRPVGGFSTGMRQRAKLAQALVADPELILLDEPTAGLDPLGREQMLDLIRRLAGFGISILVATHLLDDVQQVCDHVVMIDAGTLVVSGAVRELLSATSTVRVDVGAAGPQLATALGQHGVEAAVRDDGWVEVRAEHDPRDLVRDVVAELGLGLHALATGRTSLDEVFLDRATAGRVAP
jgi:ABC-2 type transport system ATP-binding protein